MSRNEVIRHEVLNRDGHRCQICGADENLEVHHVISLGMGGGSKELDVPENMITLCAECHQMLHNNKLRITSWVPGIRLAVEDREGHGIQGLWFDRTIKKRAAEEAMQRLHFVETIDAKVASDLYAVREGYEEIDSTARSFAEFISGLGWKPEHAEEAARAWEYVYTRSLEWPYGVNYKKILLLASAEPEDPKTWRGLNGETWSAQLLLDDLVDTSISVMKEKLIQMGLLLGDWGTYVVFPKSLVTDSLGAEAKVRVVRARSRERVMEKADELGKGFVVAGPLAFRKGLKWIRKDGGHLVDAYGKDIAYEIW